MKRFHRLCPNIARTLIVLVAGAMCLLAQNQNRSKDSELVFQGQLSDWPSAKLRPVVLPDGRMIVAVADTVYMVDANGKQLWKYKDDTLVSEPAFNSALNEVAVVMYDLWAVRLNATTGKVKWTPLKVGRGLFSSVSSYEKGFLVVVDMSGYRENSRDPSIPDRLEYWGESDKDFWYIDFPKNASLVVDGNKIYALHRKPDKVSLLELHPPQ